jgi:hypothetical protein
MTYSQNLLD